MNRITALARSFTGVIALAGGLAMGLLACTAEEGGNSGEGDATATPTAMLTASPSPESGHGPGEATATPAATLVAPDLREVEPSVVARGGGTLRVRGYGGYYRQGGYYDESSRNFEMWLDGASLGEILSCYVNRCQAEVPLPPSLAAGEHELTTVGGSAIRFSVQSLRARPPPPVAAGAERP
jgi:hypothetical protein